MQTPVNDYSELIKVLEAEGCKVTTDAYGSVSFETKAIGMERLNAILAAYGVGPVPKYEGSVCYPRSAFTVPQHEEAKARA